MGHQPYKTARKNAVAIRCGQIDTDGSGTISLEEFEAVLAGQANFSRGMSWLGMLTRSLYQPRSQNGSNGSDITAGVNVFGGAWARS